MEATRTDRAAPILTPRPGDARCVPRRYGGGMATDPTCRVCGAAFKASPAGTTVNCPAHRGTVRKAKTKTWAPVACGRCGHVHTTLRCDRCGF